MIEEHESMARERGYFLHKRNQQNKYWVYETIGEQLKDHLYGYPKIKAIIENKEGLVMGGEVSSFIAAKDILDRYFKSI